MSQRAFPDCTVVCLRISLHPGSGGHRPEYRAWRVVALLGSLIAEDDAAIVLAGFVTAPSSGGSVSYAASNAFCRPTSAAALVFSLALCGHDRGQSPPVRPTKVQRMKSASASPPYWSRPPLGLDGPEPRK